MAVACSWSTTASHLLHRVRSVPSLCAYTYKWKPWRDPCSRTQAAVCLCSSTNTDAEPDSRASVLERGTALQNRRARRSKESPRAMKFIFGSKTLTLEKARKLAAENAAADKILKPTLTEELTSDKAENEGRARGPLSVPSMKTMYSTLKGPKPTPETTQLANYVKKAHKLTQPEQDSYAKSLPSVIGTSVEDIQERVEKFRAVGFKSSEIDYLLPKFPSLMNFDLQALRNVHDVYRQLQNLGWHQAWIHGLLKRHKFLFLHDSKEVSKGLAALAKMGLKNNHVASLLIKEPLLLFHPPAEDILQRITSLSAVGFGSRWISRALYHNLYLRPARVELGPDVGEVARIVKEELGLDLTYLVIFYPQIFQMEAKQLECVIRTLRGKPLFLDTRDLHHVFSHVPHMMPHLAAIKSLSQHLEEFFSAFLSPHRAIDALLRRPKILMSQDVGSKVELLRTMGFTDVERDRLIYKMPFLLMKNTKMDFEPRMRLLLDVFKITPSTLVAIKRGGRAIVSSKVGVMQARCSYIKKYNEELLDISRVNDIFLSSDEELAAFCNQDPQDYLKEMGRFARPSHSRKHHPRNKKKVLAVDATTEVGEKRDDSQVGVDYTRSDEKWINEFKDAAPKNKVASKYETPGFELQPEVALTLSREGITEEGVDLLDSEYSDEQYNPFDAIDTEDDDLFQTA